MFIAEIFQLVLPSSTRIELRYDVRDTTHPARQSSVPAFTRYPRPGLCRRRLVREAIFRVRAPCQGTMALRREALHVGMLVPYRKYSLFGFIVFCSRFCGYFLSDTKCDPNPSRLQRYLDILVRFEHHLVPGLGRQAPENSRCHPSLDDWSVVVSMSQG